jgi:hypothetical protein
MRQGKRQYSSSLYSVLRSLRPKARVLDLIGILSMAYLEERGREGVVCSVMKAWKGSPYRLSWQWLLSCELLSLPAAGIWHMYSNNCPGLFPEAVVLKKLSLL